MPPSNEPENGCPLSTDLHHRLHAFIRAGSGNFAELALELFAFQYRHNPAYRAFCDRRRAPVTRWEEIPAVPTSAFKEFAVASFPIATSVAEFHTSGTTTAKAGKHYFKTLDLYDAASQRNFAGHLLVGQAARTLINDKAATAEDRRAAGPTNLPVLALTPAPVIAPHSSLAHMLAVVAGQDREFFVEHDTLLLERLTQRLCEMQWSSQPVMLLGTAFAFVHLFDHLATMHFDLPAGSRAMETGGFKGRSREVTKPELYRLFTQQLGIPADHIVNEYGMTELSTQFYDVTMRIGRQSDHKDVPPWARVLIIDPATGEPAPVGARGLIRVVDLANLWSALCVQTEDLGMAHADGTFEVLGRVAGAEVRGCSLNAESLRKQ